jgi:hypothetical protein
MDQTEFQRALKRHQNLKARKAASMAAADPVRVDPVLPFAEQQVKPKKEKPAEAPRPQPKNLEVVVTGPVEFNFSIYWAGTLLGGQMNQQTLKELFAKHLLPIGRVTFK